MGGNVTPTAMHKVVVNDGESTGRGTTTVPVSNASVTINLQDSMGSPLIDGVVKYYSGGWNDFGTTDENGQVSKELPIGTCQFRMTYEHGSNDISQDIGTDATVAFSTVNTTVELRDSDGNLVDTGSVKYYSGGWHDLGTITDGNVSRELLPNSYKFRMTYEHGSNDISQDLVTDPTVVFSTGKIISDSGACTHYYSVGWQIFTNDMEMLPGSYKFSFSDETPDGYYNIDADTTNNIH